MKMNVSSTRVKTYEGAPAHVGSTEQQLRRAVASCLLWEDSFYEDGVSIAERIKDLVAKTDSKVVANLAIEARSQMNLRHVPLLLVRELARRGGNRLVGDTLYEVIQRPDEITEFLAIYWADGKHPLTKQMKLGLARAFHKFGEYQLAKYNGGKGAIRLRDALFLCHAKPKNAKEDDLWKRLIEDKLETPDTWEVSLSGGADKAETFTRLIEERKLGGLAVLRNLRNMIQSNVPKGVIKEGILTANYGRVLPFRFIAAATYAPQFEPELEVAMFEALRALPKLHGTTALVLDMSGSMFGPKISSKSEIDRADAAIALAMLLREICDDVNIYAFHNDVFHIPPRRGFALRDAIKKVGAGGSYGGKAVDKANAHGYDRIIVLTDGQWHDYCPPPIGKSAYMFNVASYENGVATDGKWTNINGWSENLIRYIQEVESFNAG